MSPALLYIVWYLSATVAATMRTTMRLKPRHSGPLLAGQPKSLPDSERSRMLPSTVVAAVVGMAALGAKAERAVGEEGDVQRRSEAYLNDDMLKKAEINVQSDDFWYPPFLIGEWDTQLLFDSAKFVEKLDVEKLASSGELPGFAKYSVFFLPEMGKDIPSVPLRFVQIDGHPREDHPHNIRSLVNAFAGPDAQVDAAPYSFQKAPTWLRSPANSWRIEYHDAEGRGVVDLLTQKRNLRVFAGTVESAEFIRQTHRRAPLDASPSRLDAARPVVTDYCLNWRLTVPASLKDEFITVDDLRKTDTVLGALDVYVYLQPSSPAYSLRPGRPAGVFTYDVTMRRPAGFDERQAAAETERTNYPFVWRDAGPVELDAFFVR